MNEKLVCIINKNLNSSDFEKVLRVSKSVAENEYMVGISDWRYTSKAKYKKYIKNSTKVYIAPPAPGFKVEKVARKFNNRKGRVKYQNIKQTITVESKDLILTTCEHKRITKHVRSSNDSYIPMVYKTRKGGILTERVIPGSEKEVVLTKTIPHINITTNAIKVDKIDRKYILKPIGIDSIISNLKDHS